jgi:FixJ family two-component response regulator
MDSLQEKVASEYPLVAVVDDDESVRESLPDLLREFGFATHCFSCAEEFLTSDSLVQTGCLILDIAMPGMTGFDLQRELKLRGHSIPIIFITRYGDVPTTVQAMKAGAVEFLTKPFGDNVLLSAIRHALDRSHSALGREAEMQVLRDCYASLTCREREVMTLVVSGLLNKQVGGELGISEITVKAHRGQVMQKMKADSFADLVNKAARLGLAPAPKS